MVLKEKIRLFIALFFLVALSLIITGCEHGDEDLSCDAQAGYLCDFNEQEICPDFEDYLESLDNDGTKFCCSVACVAMPGDPTDSCEGQGGDLCDLNVEFCDPSNVLAAEENDELNICCDIECEGTEGTSEDAGCVDDLDCGGSEKCLEDINGDFSCVMVLDGTCDIDSGENVCNSNDCTLCDNDGTCSEGCGESTLTCPEDCADDYVPQCSNGIDDDGDGFCDYDDGDETKICLDSQKPDPGCDSLLDDDESNETNCSDGEDNDNDGLIDYKLDGTGDPGCDSAEDDTESDDGTADDGTDDTDDGGEDDTTDDGIGITEECNNPIIEFTSECVDATIVTSSEGLAAAVNCLGEGADWFARTIGMGNVNNPDEGIELSMECCRAEFICQ